MSRTITSNPAKAFKKGLREIRVKDVDEVREALMRILGVGTKQALNFYATGKAVNLDVLKAQQIAGLFLSYGVTDPWGL